MLHRTEKVSIPFKREGLSERTLAMAIIIFMTGFNSLQTGRSFRTPQTRQAQFHNEGFQFPSNGKVFPNEKRIEILTQAKPVSIPFKREGLSELNNYIAYRIRSIMFQFPSNGKVFPNL